MRVHHQSRVAAGRRDVARARSVPPDPFASLGERTIQPANPGEITSTKDIMHRAPSILLAGLFLSGCAQLETPVAPEQNALANISPATAGPVSRPWVSRCDGIAVFTDPTTLRITGTCNITHLGRTTVDATETVIPRPDGLFDLNSVNTYTAANGDILYTTSAGLATLKPDFSGVTFSGVETAVGGTGRFSNASGSATRIGSTRFSDNVGSYEHVGTLTYAASDGH